MQHEFKLVILASALMFALPVGAQTTGGSAAPKAADSKPAASTPLPKPNDAKAPASTAAPKVIDANGAADVITVTTKVLAVDPAKRTVTIRGQMGKTMVLKVSDDVKNFAQIKVGDNIVAKYAQAVSVKLERGVAGRSETVTTAAATAPAGSKPAAGIVQQTVIVANVERIDRAGGILLLEGPNAGYAEVRVNDPAMMKDVKVNDKVVATVTEAVVVSVRTMSSN